MTVEGVLVGLGVLAGVVVVGYVAWRILKFMLTDRGGFGGGP